MVVVVALTTVSSAEMAALRDGTSAKRTLVAVAALPIVAHRREITHSRDEEKEGEPMRTAAAATPLTTAHPLR